MVTKQNILIFKVVRFNFSETLKGISNALQNLELVQSRVDEIVGESIGIKCGSKIAWYKKG